MVLVLSLLYVVSTALAIMILVLSLLYWVDATATAMMISAVSEAHIIWTD